jgi:hypothetical protein
MIRDDFNSRLGALAFEREYYSPDGKGWKEFIGGLYEMPTM